ncbi:type II secretion system minor pseudopilin GspK [Salinivibrio sp. ES.052]|uniref:type II secretion system minor pseudopilin GspK n=1 Tax=Salinivibrio sp. ES.052 TaxID=1882823 RepID=UPI00092B0F8E|nr:type II secretion system minor pseudopilin GspK [Salinivibrio sp. ES.052]SIO24405.1 type II secretion system protein K (GspK) [Salinivibrio sp. ES.052]
MIRQRGAALLVVMMIMALMTAIAGSMASRLFTNYHRAENQLHFQQAYWYSQAVEALAAAVLRDSLSGSETVNLSQNWAEASRTFPLKGGEVSGHLQDAQACFNLNSLQLRGSTVGGPVPYEVSVLRALIGNHVEDSYQADVIAQASRDYIDENNQLDQSLGAEDAHYESVRPAYVTPDAVIADVSEWRAVRGVNGTVFRQLSPQLCAIPSAELKVNVNTLTDKQAALLSALFTPALPVEQAKQVLAQRPESGWESVEAFMATLNLTDFDDADRKQVAPHLSVTSHYFLLQADVHVASAQRHIQALLHYQDGGQVSVLRRRFGGMRERATDNQDQ